MRNIKQDFRQAIINFSRRMLQHFCHAFPSYIENLNIETRLNLGNPGSPRIEIDQVIQVVLMEGKH
jgi:tRNA(Glu) U13 pseudouridine synthase TruD